MKQIRKRLRTYCCDSKNHSTKMRSNGLWQQHPATAAKVVSHIPVGIVFARFVAQTPSRSR